MIKLENFKIYKSDKLNYKIEEFRTVESTDKETKAKKSVDKWVKHPDYFNSLEHALLRLLNGDMVDKLVQDEEQDIKQLLEKVNETFDRLKVEVIK